jgi:4-diphosphocytidyl-2-C-methyl-D-erythritol kinase
MDIKINAYAKINLKLKVLGDLPGGYHELYNHMQAVGLCDRVYIDYHDMGAVSAKEAEGYRPRVILHPGKPYLPRDERNLAWKAAELMHRRFHPDRREKFFISVEKNIPVAAGLAGGSADGAAVLTGLARLWGLIPGYGEGPETANADQPGAEVSAADRSEAAAGSPERPSLQQLEPLIELAKELGSDVPFSLLAQNGYPAAVGTGRGTELELVTSESYKVLIYTPNFPLSTKAVYGELKDGDASEFNDLEPPAKRLSPEIEAVMELMKGIGTPLRTQLSGSGPSVFNLYSNKGPCPSLKEVKAALANREGNIYLGETLE